MQEISEPRTKTRTIVVFAMLFAVLGAVVVFAYFATFSRPVTTVILVRHAEKILDPNNQDPDLSPEGFARAQEIARVFSGTGINTIFATQYKRTQQTAEPLSKSIGVPITLVDAKQPEELVKRIQTSLRGQTIFVSGHNDTVPQIASALSGENFPPIPQNEYDNVYIVTVYRFGKARVIRLKFGKTSHG
jgi:broad specificity phosphatase PhoE